MSESQVQSSDETLDLIDETLDDLADLPQVAPFPIGTHLAKMFISKKDGKVKDGVKAPPSYLVTFEYLSVLELADPSKTPPAAGDKAFVNIYTKKKDGTPNEIGQGQLKVLLKPLSERLNTSSVNELILATKDGVEVGITTGIKKGNEGYSDQMTVVKCMLS